MEGGNLLSGHHGLMRRHRPGALLMRGTLGGKEVQNGGAHTTPRRCCAPPLPLLPRISVPLA